MSALLAVVSLHPPTLSCHRVAEKTQHTRTDSEVMSNLNVFPKEHIQVTFLTHVGQLWPFLVSSHGWYLCHCFSSGWITAVKGNRAHSDEQKAVSWRQPPHTSQQFHVVNLDVVNQNCRQNFLYRNKKATLFFPQIWSDVEMSSYGQAASKTWQSAKREATTEGAI